MRIAPLCCQCTNSTITAKFKENITYTIQINPPYSAAYCSITNSVPFDITYNYIYWSQEEYQDGSIGEVDHTTRWTIKANTTSSQTCYWDDGPEPWEYLTILGKEYWYHETVNINYNNKVYTIYW